MRSTMRSTSSSSTPLRVAAVIPAYQAAPSIGAVARDTLAILADVLVLDDGSTDGTAEVARREAAASGRLGAARRI